MGHSTENQGGQLPPSTEDRDINEDCEQQPMPMININSTSDQPPLTSSMTGAATQVYHIPNPACSNILPLQVPIDPMSCILKYGSSSSTMTANPENVSFISPHEILNYINRVDQDMKTILNHQVLLLHSTIKASLKMHRKSLFQMLEQVTINQVREKHAELESSKRMKAELEEMTRQICSKRKMLVHDVNNNEIAAHFFKKEIQAKHKKIFPQEVAKKASAQAEAMMEDKVKIDGALILANEVHGSPQVEAVAAVAENAVVSGWATCKVCQKAKVKAYILPCNHHCLCKECNEKFGVCPICNVKKVASATTSC